MRVLITLSAMVLLSGCAELYEPSPVSAPLEGNTTISRTSAIANTYVVDRDNNTIICAEPPPDSAFSQGESGGFAISMLNFGGRSDQAEESDDREEVEMQGRTPGTLMTRELFFRLCEFSRNYQLTKDEAKELHLKTLSTVAAGWQSEAQNTTITVGEQSSHTINQTITGDAPTIRILTSGNTESDDSSSTSSSITSSDLSSSSDDSSSYDSSDSYLGLLAPFTLQLQL